jgi:hypothetical protein
MSSILAMEPLIQEMTSEICPMVTLMEFGKLEEAVSMHHWANGFAFDVVGQLYLGGKVSFIEKGK